MIFRLSWSPLCLLLIAVSCTSRDPAAVKAESLRRGDELAAKKQYGQALAAYRKAVASDPNDGRARLKLANTAVLAHSWNEAGSAAREAAHLLPDDPEPQILAAELQLGPQQFADAARRASLVLARQPDNVRALVVFGRAKARFSSLIQAIGRLDDAAKTGGDYRPLPYQVREIVSKSDDQAAEAAFRRAVQVAPRDLNAAIALANFLWATDRADEAEWLLKRWADGPSDSYPKRLLGRFYLSRHRIVDGEKYLRAAVAQGDSEALFVLADHFVASKRDEDAVSILGGTSAKDDTTGDVTLRLAPIEFRSGQRDQAMRRVNALLARAPDNNRAVVLKAQFLLSRGDLDQSLRLARDAVSRDPNSTEARSTLANALFATGDLDTAFREYTEAFRLDPESAQLPLQLAKLAIELGHRQEALQYSRDAVRKNPDSLDAAVALVKTLVAVRDYSTADWELKSLLARYPGSAELLGQLGAVHLGRGDDAAARSAFVRALQLDHNSLDAFSGLVSLDLKGRHLADARQRVDTALGTHPDDPEYLLLAAQVYSAQNDVSRAETTFRRVLELNRTNEGAAIALANFFSRRQRLDEAKRVLEQLLEQRPGSVDVQTSLGMLLEQMGKRDEARSLYEKLVARNTRAGTAAYRLAALYVDQGGNLDAALDLATSAKQQMPTDPGVSDVLGWVYTRKNLPAIAIPHLQDAVRAVPDNAAYRFHLGSAYLRQGDIKQARDQFTRVLQLNPNFSQAEQVRTALASMRKTGAD